jgi:arginase
MLNNKYYLIGFASGMAGVDPHAARGPIVTQHSSFFKALLNRGFSFHWDTMIQSPPNLSMTADAIRVPCERLAKRVAEIARARQMFSVIGGDHTSAIGTWSGVYDALKDQGDIGLIWIDAHMDSHTPETSESGRIHGMPLACLLGYGYPSLTSLLNLSPKLKPNHVCLIGIRSYEKGEAELLKKLNVRIYFMDEVKERGFATVLKEAVALISANTVGYGLSIDLDGLDPLEVPGVDVPEPDGILAKDFIKGLSMIAHDPKLLGTEIVEFDPSRDQEQKTEKMIIALLETLYVGKYQVPSK